MKRIVAIALNLMVQAWVFGAFAQAQSAVVTVKLDTNRIDVGASTTLHVFAQIIPAQRASSDRIFSWYVDLLNSDGNLAKTDFARLQKPTSDNDPRTSSTGASDGPNRRGVHDTFIHTAGAGRDAPVELFSVPVTGLAGGQVTFRVAPGTVAGLSADFIVAPLEGPDPLVGGVYDSASVELEVVGKVPCVTTLNIGQADLTGGRNRVTIRFAPCEGRVHVLEYRDTLDALSWQTVPGAPHNSGILIETNAVPARFYRLRIEAE